VIAACVSILYRPSFIFPSLMAIGGFISFTKETIQEFIQKRMEKNNIQQPENIVEWVKCLHQVICAHNESNLITSPLQQRKSIPRYHSVPRPIFGIIVLIVFIACATTVFIIPYYIHPPVLFSLFITFFKIGCTIFGGGNVLVRH
jgi:predicted DNA repair protein MutK